MLDIPCLTGDILEEHCGHLTIICCLVRKKPAITAIATIPNASAAFQVGVSHETMNSNKRKRVTANAKSLTENSK